MSELHETIYRILLYSPRPLAVHEIRENESIKNFHTDGVSENSIASRLCEPALKGRVWGATRAEKRYKEWWWKPFTDEHKAQIAHEKGELFL